MGRIYETVFEGCYNRILAAMENRPSTDKEFQEIGTGTHNRNGKISIEIGDESFQFKGKDSPEWLAAAIYHESFHAKNYFKPDKPVMVTESRRLDHIPSD